MRIFKKFLQCESESVARAYHIPVSTTFEQHPHDLSQDITIQGTEAWDLITGRDLNNFSRDRSFLFSTVSSFYFFSFSSQPNFLFLFFISN